MASTVYEYSIYLLYTRYVALWQPVGYDWHAVCATKTTTTTKWVWAQLVLNFYIYILNVTRIHIALRIIFSHYKSRWSIIPSINHFISFSFKFWLFMGDCLNCSPKANNFILFRQLSMQTNENIIIICPPRKPIKSLQTKDEIFIETQAKRWRIDTNIHCVVACTMYNVQCICTIVHTDNTHRKFATTIKKREEENKRNKIALAYWCI